MGKITYIKAKNIEYGKGRNVRKQECLHVELLKNILGTNSSEPTNGVFKPIYGWFEKFKGRPAYIVW